MFQHTNRIRSGVTFVMMTVLIMSSSALKAIAGDGANLARATLQRVEAARASFPSLDDVEKRDAALSRLRQEVAEQLSQFSAANRVEYVEYMARVISKGDDQYGPAYIFLGAGGNATEAGQAFGHLLASDEPRVRLTGERLLFQLGGV